MKKTLCACMAGVWRACSLLQTQPEQTLHTLQYSDCGCIQFTLQHQNHAAGQPEYHQCVLYR